MISEGVDHIILEGVTGQRYIGAGLDPNIVLEIKGIPGQDLGVFNDGATIIVYGNAQDGVGNTMNNGHVIVHGNAGDIPGHMMRNGKIYIKGSAGFRAGIMMKEYGKKRPVMIVGETIGDYLGEYMAGGAIVVLGNSLNEGESPVSRHVASGIFGGELYIRGDVGEDQLGEGAVKYKAGQKEIEKVSPYLEEYAEIFKLDLDKMLNRQFYVIRRAGQRPYGDLYVPSSKIKRDFKPVHRNRTPPCAHACPVGIPNPVVIRYLKEGKIEEAFELLDDYTPFRFSCCGMVCPGLCRAACTRSNLSGPVRIDEISKQNHPTGKVSILEGSKKESICIIGAGPSGLSAAWHLARYGYKVDVYEKDEDIGGKLTHNIPDDRLSPRDVSRDLKRIRSLGIKFITGSGVDKKLFSELKDRYSAVIIAAGAQKPRTLGFQGEDKAVSSFHFLRTSKMGEKEWDLSGKSVVILGAGNVAMDAACECYRFSADSVTAVDVQKPAAFGRELEKAVALGTKILFPRYIEKYEKGKVHFTNGGELKADLLIEAVGEIPELDFAGEKLIYDKEHFNTNVPGIYVIGDAVAPGLVTHSIGMGLRVAKYLHSIFQGIPIVEETVGQQAEVVDKKNVNIMYFQKREIYDNDLDECFPCGTCIHCDICVDNCPRGVIKRIGDSFHIDLEICTGCGVCAAVCPRGAITMEST
jgi:NADPH-dependent glutamate synthase beta subunit-like oxidoreductase/glutamate synthase domain-containing protein 3/Pyruvate/2-oxoacid:ferredoxin oxidoreductase delta subunit